MWNTGSLGSKRLRHCLTVKNTCFACMYDEINCMYACPCHIYVYIYMYMYICTYISCKSISQIKTEFAKQSMLYLQLLVGPYTIIFGYLDPLGPGFRTLAVSTLRPRCAEADIRSSMVAPANLRSQTQRVQVPKYIGTRPKKPLQV